MFSSIEFIHVFCNYIKILYSTSVLQVEKLAEKEKNLKAKRGWFGFLWSGSQAEEAQDLNSAAAISN